MFYKISYLSLLLNFKYLKDIMSNILSHLKPYHWGRNKFIHRDRWEACYNNWEICVILKTKHQVFYQFYITFAKHSISICMVDIKSICHNLICIASAMEQSFFRHHFIHFFCNGLSSCYVPIPQIWIFVFVQLWTENTLC